MGACVCTVISGAFDLPDTFPVTYPLTDHRAPAPMNVSSATAKRVVWDVAQPRVRREFNLTRSILQNFAASCTGDVDQGSQGHPKRWAIVARNRARRRPACHQNWGTVKITS